MLALIAAAVAVAAAVAAAPQASPSPVPGSDAAARQAAASLDAARRDVTAARRGLVANFDVVQQRSGLAVLLETRLDEDVAELDRFPSPTVMSAQDYAEAIALDIKMTASVVDQLATGTYHDLASARGVDEVLVKSPADGTMQPLAVYVPATYAPDRHYSLVVLLHGRGESESAILAVKWFRQLADRTNTIVVAPYGRGDSLYEDPAPIDVYAALDAASRAFNADPHRTFLAGYSMGGYGVYQIGPQHVDRWAAFLAIAGGPTNRDRQAVLTNFVGKSVYVVSGLRDDVIPNSYMRAGAQMLRQAGIATGYYEQADGTHNLYTIFPAIERAWSDMLAGVQPHNSIPAPGSVSNQTIPSY